MLVMKFGGTSVQDSRALRSVASIVRSATAAGEPVIAVLSATSGTTNELLRCARAAGGGHDVHSDVEAIAERHRAILTELAPSAPHDGLNAVLAELAAYTRALGVLDECTDQSLDHMASFGERLSTTILHAAFVAEGADASFLDVRTVMSTDDHFVSAAVNMAETKRRCMTTLAPMLRPSSIVVTQGFIGSTPDGRTTTLGRGGSDYSAAILGACLSAREIQIWTDVSGVYSADPRIAADARPIPSLDFDEVRELALYGAKVLHPDTIAPAIDASIPVLVLNTFRPDDPGTRIEAGAASTADIHAVSIVRSCRIVRCSVSTATHIRSLTELAPSIILDADTIESSLLVIHAPTETTSLAVDVATADAQAEVRNASLLAVSGPNVMHPRVTAAIAEALRSFDVRLFVSGAARHTVFAAVDASAGEDALRAVHAIIPHRQHPARSMHGEAL
jgi:aspartate kinase